MSTLPARANVVVIGAGIVGNSLAYHLAKQGWTEIVLLDKGPLPNPGGSTGHASNFIFPTDHNKEMTALTLDSMAQYQELGVFTESGGIEVARTPERMQELTLTFHTRQRVGEIAAGAVVFERARIGHREHGDRERNELVGCAHAVSTAVRPLRSSASVRPPDVP